MTSRGQYPGGYRAVVTVIRERSRMNLDSAWRSIGWLVVGLAVWQGVGYAIGGNSATTSNQWRHVVAPLPGQLRTHGIILLALGSLLAWELRGRVYRLWTRWLLRAFRLYSLLIALAWVYSWRHGVSWAPPAWWALLAGLVSWLSVWAPLIPVDEGAHYRQVLRRVLGR